MRGLVRIFSGKAIQWRGPAIQSTTGLWKLKSCCPHPLPKNQLLFGPSISRYGSHCICDTSAEVWGSGVVGRTQALRSCRSGKGVAPGQNVKKESAGESLRFSGSRQTLQRESNMSLQSQKTGGFRLAESPGDSFLTVLGGQPGPGDSQRLPRRLLFDFLTRPVLTLRLPDRDRNSSQKELGMPKFRWTLSKTVRDREVTIKIEFAFWRKISKKKNAVFL